MRLININNLESHDFGDAPPPYATLSHRWQGDEISYEAFLRPETRRGRGFDEITSFCTFLRAINSGKVKHPILRDFRLFQVSWCWVDTCCIDKRSSAELSESINSMANWYRRSQLCVVHLSDVPPSLPQDETEMAVSRSEWFRCGWTLQELIFPRSIIFCDRDWNMVPGMEKDAPLITKVTGIPEECLNDSGNVFRQSVTRRMSWAAGRTTTRREDEAYCLLGLFNVKMPLLYGERADAFLRLQEETMKRSNDESIFAWTSPAGPGQPTTAFLARRPAAFEHGGNVIRAALGDRNHYLLGAKGLELQAKTVVFEDMSASGWDGLERIFLLQLNCYTLLEDHRPQACLIAMAQYKDDLMARVPTWDIGQELWQRLIGSSNRPVRRNPEQMFLLAMTSTDFDEEELLSGHTAQRGTQTLDDLYGLLPQDRRDNLAEDRSQPTPPTIDLTREAM